MEEYIVIETHGGAAYSVIIINEDGNTKVFNTIEDAIVEANNCQDGLIVRIT
jgi:hypothetical protein